MRAIMQGLTDAEFERLYGAEEQCLAAWVKVRQDAGMPCPRCGNPKSYVYDRRVGCTRCDMRWSITSGTVMADTKLPLTAWFRGMHLMTSTKQCISGVELGRRLGVSYPTAWYLHKRLRHAMTEESDRCQLGAPAEGNWTPIVEADDVYLGGERNEGSGTAGKTRVIAAAERWPSGRMGAVIMRVVDSFSNQEAAAFRDRWGGRPQASECQNPGRAKTNRQGPSAMAITMIGLDTAKSVFQVHGVDSAGKVQLKRKLRREELLSFFEKQEKCTVVIEACGAGHHWARVLTALGHDVKLVAPEAARPFVKKGKKNDPADAAALCEAARRPDIKFVPIKTTEQQAALALHSARSLLVKQETMLANAMRGLATEFGVTVPKGMDKLEELIAQVGTDETIPECARQAIGELHSHCGVVATRIATLEAKIVNHARHDETARRLATVPGIGPITASMISASVGDNIGAFKSARHFAAWLGLVPSQHSTGGKIRLGRITKTGNKEIRRLLVLGATSMVRRAAQWNSAAGIWVRGVLERRPVRLATVALANKMARIAWALMTRKEVYRAKGGASVAVEAVA